MPAGEKGRIVKTSGSQTVTMPTFNRPPETILFDLDGTLIDTYHLYLESYRRALEPHLGRRPALEEFYARRPASERHFLTAWIGRERAELCHQEVRRHYAELHGALCEGIYDGVREMLAGLRSAGYRLGVVTGKGRDTWNTTRDALGLDGFEVVVTEDDVDQPKPDPAGLIQALQALRVEPGAAVYIGDALSDLEAGRRAGTRVAAALWPKTEPADREGFLEQIRPLEPDWVFERPADLVREWARWC
jgi:HAD superfamily hydrolase (TIGR01549 family)